MQNVNYQKIKGFPAACKAEGLDPVKLVAKWEKNGDTKDEIAYKMWKIFLKAINGTWVADFTNPNQEKWFGIVWVEKKKKGAGFRVTCARTDWTDTGTGVGSRLCTETREQFLHALKYGEQMYLDFYLA
jgi:hypothetical protein